MQPIFEVTKLLQNRSYHSFSLGKVLDKITFHSYNAMLKSSKYSLDKIRVIEKLLNALDYHLKSHPQKFSKESHTTALVNGLGYMKKH